MARKRFTLDEETGLLTARDGTVLHIASMSVDIASPEAASHGGPIGGAVVEGENSVGGEQGTLLREGGVGETQKASPAPDDLAITSVWEHYVAVHKPRNTTLPPAERKLIRDALKVAGHDEIKLAITGCSLSAFHMGDNDRRRKYNSLSQIIKGRQGRETTRERIDYFIDIAAKAGRHGVTQPHERGRISLDLSEIPSSIRATVASQRGAVRKALAGDANEHEREMGRKAMEWLKDRTGQEPVVEGRELKGWRYAE